jgi:hypothetical protein
MEHDASSIYPAEPEMSLVAGEHRKIHLMRFISVIENEWLSRELITSFTGIEPLDRFCDQTDKAFHPIFPPRNLSYNVLYETKRMQSSLSGQEHSSTAARRECPFLGL